jgi:CubicO group peptidase (beta-lactamase class C family)
MDADILRAWLDGRVTEHLFSGVALVWRDGGPLFSYAGGLADRGHVIPVTEASRFGVASITKVVTAVTALRLVDRGLVRLDQPLVEVLPVEQRPVALTAEHTLHHLLSHTSGLTNYHDDADKTWTSFTSCWDRIPSYHLRKPADMLPLFADLPASFPPGTRYQYADANYILAGLVIEAVTGRGYIDAATDEVLRIAGMSDTAFDALDADPPGLATGYMVADDVPAAGWRTNIYSVPAMGMPDGGLFTTARDLIRLLDALRAGRLVSPTLLAAMQAPQGPPSDAVEQYGYGLELTLVGGRVAIIGHGGSDPGVSALVSHFVAEGTTIVVLCNFDRGSWAVTQRLEADLGLVDPRT